MATEDKLWLPPLLPKDQKRLDHLRNKRKKSLPKWTGFSSKTLWDWLQLLGVIAIPIVVVIVSIAFSIQQDASNQRQHDIDLQIASDQQQEATLKAYLDDISSLLLDKHLRTSKPNDEIRQIARAKTLTALRRMDADRKEILLRFLYEAGLIGVILERPNGPPVRGEAIVNLDGANLSGAILNQSDLGGADLSGTDLSRANLSYHNVPPPEVESGAPGPGGFGVTNSSWGPANISLIGTKLERARLTEANLSGATLFRADLHLAILNGVDLSGADLGSADLSEADLRGANLRGADLCGANLNVAHLRGADLSSANLKNAIVTQEQLAKAKSLKGTIMPDGSTHP